MLDPWALGEEFDENIPINAECSKVAYSPHSQIMDPYVNFYLL